VSITKIEWADRVWNPVVGCQKVGKGCKHCYAEQLHTQRHKAYLRGKLQNIPQYKFPFEKLQYLTERLYEPYKWKKPCMVFVNSMGDLFMHLMDREYLYEILEVIGKTKHTYIILTKRAVNMMLMLNLYYTEKRMKPLKNLWIGISVSTQRDFEMSIGFLENTKAAVKLLSIEPILENIELYNYSSFNWIIAGCETGKRRRKAKLGWFFNLAEQCKKEGIPLFIKQMEVEGAVETEIEKFPQFLKIKQFCHKNPLGLGGGEKD